jgi:aminopeptidase N/puromycin-sensitive aminopeptidase
MNLAAAVKSDSNADVVDSALEGVTSIYERVAASAEERAGVGAWIRKNFSPEFAKLGAPAESDSANTRELRARLLRVLGYYGKDPAILAQARQIAQKYLSDPSSVESTLGQTALSIAARNGDAELFTTLQQVAETNTNPEFQEGALQLLAEFEDPALEKRSLDYAVSGKVRNQDALIQFAIALQDDATRDLAWSYVKSHWEAVRALLTPELGNALVGSSGAFCSAEAREDVKAFYAEHKVPSADRALKHAIEHIDGCIELRSLQEPNLKQWLAAQPAQ